MVTRGRALAALGALALAGGAPALRTGAADAAQNDVRALARDAYVFGYPLVLMMVTKRLTNAASGGAFVHMLSGPTPPFRFVVAPNGDTRYSSVWADLSAEPQVLHVPDAGGRYFVAQVMDAWTDVIADPTPRIPGSSPGDYAIAGPAWNGAVPAGVRLVRCSTNDAWILARTRARPGDPPDAIAAIQREYSLTPLSRFGDATYREPAVFRDPDVPTPVPPEIVASMPAATFFAALSAALVPNPPRAADAPLIARLRAAGLLSMTPERASGIAPDAAIALGVADARALLASYDPPSVPHVNGWRYTHDTGRFGSNYLYRAFIARTLLAANLPEDAVYADAGVDGHGAPLNGDRRVYGLRFAANAMPPANAFWSLTMYSPDGYLVSNPIGRYTLRDDALLRDADGSILVTIAHTAPNDTKNWLPAPAGPFVVTLRMYWPRPAAIDGTYAIPPIELVAPQRNRD